MSYNDCTECPHYNKASCPLSSLSQKLKERACPFLKLKIHLDETKINLREPLPSSYFPKWLTENKDHQEMDYNRDDTKQIVNSMRPFNN